MIIRNYQPKDYDQIIQILKLSENDMFDENWDSRANFDELSKHDPSNVLVVEIDGRVVGTQRIVPIGPDVAILYRLAVYKDFREQGIGSELLARAFEVAKERNIRELGMYVDSKNDHLKKYYETRGYTPSTDHTYQYLWRKVGDE